MIRPLRATHRTAVTALAAIVPALLILVLLQRPAQAPSRGMGAPSPSIRVVEQVGRKRLLEIRLPADRPEVLAYWAPVGSVTIDARAVLIGRPDRALTLLTMPDNLQPGQILLYSPALNKVLAEHPLGAGASP